MVPRKLCACANGAAPAWAAGRKGSGWKSFEKRLKTKRKKLAQVAQGSNVKVKQTGHVALFPGGAMMTEPPPPQALPFRRQVHTGVLPTPTAQCAQRQSVRLQRLQGGRGSQGFFVKLHEVKPLFTGIKK